jgi:hypothetical protein
MHTAYDLDIVHMRKLDEIIEMPYSHFLVHTTKCVRVHCPYNGYLTTKYNHDSWGTCTSLEYYKNVLTAVLTVMSNMDPHMIGWDWYG